MIIGKLICALPKQIGGGHKRGKRISSPSPLNLLQHIVYQCGRCGATWTRKRKVKP